MKLKFLGTGAADWKEPDERGEYRRHASALLDGCLLIDVTDTVLDQIGDPAAITDVFFTHSHADHFDIEALRRLAPCRVYAHESWAGEIEGGGLAVIPLKTGERVRAAGFEVLPLPSNHCTSRDYETTLHYLIEKEGKRLLYATDGAWLLRRENRLIGGTVLDAAVFDATLGEEYDDDNRIFEHNSLSMVPMMVKAFHATGRLPADAPVFLTHLSRTMNGTQAEVERRMKPPFVVSRDGLEVEI